MPPIGKLLAPVIVICITLELLETSPGLSMDNGDNDVASWFGVFQSFTEYLESLTVIAEDDANVLDNIAAVLNPVLSGYRDVLKDVKCNCTSACQVGTSCDHASISMFG
ncbi:hypothetical protein EMCRGX_G019736 [Ephydatia muelleri]